MPAPARSGSHAFADLYIDKRQAQGVRAGAEAVVERLLALDPFGDHRRPTSGDPLPADAKLAWWGEELRSWAGQRSRHPLGRVLEPVRAPWGLLADALPTLVDARAVAVDAKAAECSLAEFAAAVAAVEAALFDVPLRPAAAHAVLLQTLAQRLYDAGVAGVPRSVLDQGGADAARHWAGQLLKGWGRVAGPRPRRIWSTLARARLAAQANGKQIEATPVRTLLHAGWAARG